jgi:phenylalanyl-tRNA synthetase beta chain
MSKVLEVFLMKLSLSWIFDHIIGSWQGQNIADLVAAFNRTVAEIEHVARLTIHIDHCTAVVINNKNNDLYECFSPELQSTFLLPLRSDISVGQVGLVWHKGADIRWATLGDFGSDKEGLMPVVMIPQQELSGSWKNRVETDDVILHVDNKSITHRSDLWSHRGIAREIAALLGYQIKPESNFLQDIQVQADTTSVALETVTIAVQDPQACKRFCALYLDSIENNPSIIHMATRLARIDSKPINIIVDTTNYVMFDIGQPMHAFDAQAIEGDIVGPRMARAGEKITLLDGQSITLSNHDLIIADDHKPLALAGVMGGKHSGVTPTTKTLLLEAACFDAATIRKGAMRHKCRTDASARFEKTLDPQQSMNALKRFLALLNSCGIAYTISGPMAVVGLAQDEERTITISHSFIADRLGIALTSERIVSILASLGFAVAIENGDVLHYIVTIPYWRTTKEMSRPEDLLEEIARYNGYDTIPLVLPAMRHAAFSLQEMHRERNIKQYMSSAMRAREVYNYALFDEEFLATLGWQPSRTLEVQNPISENYKRLVTSLVPHLCKNIATNSATHDRLRFFEMNAVWDVWKDGFEEHQSLAMAFYDKHEAPDFYLIKDMLDQLFGSLQCAVTWSKPSENIPVWFDRYQSAQLMMGDIVLGYAGVADAAFFAKVALGHAFIMELNADLLLKFKAVEKHFIPLSKYPITSFDISMLIPQSVTIAQIIDLVSGVDGRVKKVTLVDSFAKDEWVDKKSITIRMIAQDPERTLTKEDSAHIHNHIVIALQQLGAQIR